MAECTACVDSWPVLLLEGVGSDLGTKQDIPPDSKHSLFRFDADRTIGNPRNLNGDQKPEKERMQHKAKGSKHAAP